MPFLMISVFTRGTSAATSPAVATVHASLRSPAASARMIRREAEHRGCKGKVRVAPYENGWIADHDPMDTKYWNERKEGPVERYFVSTWDDDDRRYGFDHEKGKKLAHIKVTYIEEPVGLPLLGSGLDE